MTSLLRGVPPTLAVSNRVVLCLYPRRGQALLFCFSRVVVALMFLSNGNQAWLYCCQVGVRLYHVLFVSENLLSKNNVCFNSMNTIEA